MSINSVTNKHLTMTMNRAKRSLPYLQLLKSAPSKNRLVMLKAYPLFVIDDMVEILYNILNNNLSVPSRDFNKLVHRRKPILADVYSAARNRRLRKKLILNQKGGFIGAIIPILTSVLGGLVSSAL